MQGFPVAAGGQLGRSGMISQIDTTRGVDRRGIER